ELFKKWGTTLADTATQKLGVAKDRVTLLTDAAATRDGVVKAFGALGAAEAARGVGGVKAFGALAAAEADDTVVIVLFGHGTYANKTAKFNLTGPDMTPQDCELRLSGRKSKRVEFFNTPSASAPFVEALSGPGRVVVAATRTGGEMFATLFGGPFVEALSNESTDSAHHAQI